MKKKILFLPIITLTSISLSSCGFSQLFFETKLNTLRVNHYELYDIDSTKTYSLEEIKKSTIDVKFYPSQDYLPLLSLESYAKLIPLKEGYGYKIQSSLTTEVITIGEKASNGSIKTPYFAGQIDLSNKAISMAGSTSSILKISESSEEITKGLDYDAVSIKGDNVSSYSFSKFNINYYLNGGIEYYPLYFLDMVFSSSIGINVFYDFESIYTYDSDSSLSNFKYDNNGTTCSITTKMKSIVNNKLGNKMPNYLKEHTREIYMFMMENLYGLKKTRNISSMVNFYKENGLYNLFTNDNPATRGKALSNAINKLDDDHSGVTSNVLMEVWNEEVDTSRGEVSVARKNHLTTLTNSRNTVYENSGLTLDDVRYSSDGKLAVTVFNSFMGNQVDKLAANLEEIKNHGGVEKVVIDISTNGGGIIALLFKAMSLISEDNRFESYIFDDSSNSVVKYHGRYDANDDKKYDVDDCYGDDFEIYLLCSDSSFSCGNAFPCYAKQFKTAKIIGKNSGGGECVVAKHMLPNLFGIQHSSNNHIGYYSKYTEDFYGFEKGAVPDIEFEFEDFYDIETLYEKIS